MATRHVGMWISVQKYQKIQRWRKTEVPIAGTINGRFISRRIDRLFTDDENKRVYVLDYKTDTDRAAFHDKYVEQINEYKTLLRDIYPNYEIRGYILWLHDFSVEEI